MIIFFKKYGKYFIAWAIYGSDDEKPLEFLIKNFEIEMIE